MDLSAPITWLIEQISEIVNDGAGAAAGAIASAVTPLASVAFGIYIILITINYMRGAETEPVIDLGMRLAGFAIIIGIGLNIENYSNFIIPIVTGIGPDLASAISNGTATANGLDQLALHYLVILEEGYSQAMEPFFPANVGPLVLWALKAICIVVGLVPFLVAAAIALIVANVGSVMVAMVGPMYFAFLLFPATRQYFSSWVNTALSYALIPVFVSVVATISIGISKSMLGGDNLSETNLLSVFLATIGNLTLLFLIKQVSSLASSLSAGGINAGMPGSIGTLANSIRSGAAGSMREIKAAGRGVSAVNRTARALAKKIRGGGGGDISKNRKAG